MSNRIQLVKKKLVSQVSLPRSSALCSVFKAEGMTKPVLESCFLRPPLTLSSMSVSVSQKSEACS